jgi:hypothetical protein
MRFVQGPPILAVEEDYGPAAEDQMAAKRADYFEAGTLAVWDVDRKGECARPPSWHARTSRYVPPRRRGRCIAGRSELADAGG